MRGCERIYTDRAKKHLYEKHLQEQLQLRPRIALDMGLKAIQTRMTRKTRIYADLAEASVLQDSNMRRKKAFPERAICAGLEGIRVNPRYPWSKRFLCLVQGDLWSQL